MHSWEDHTHFEPTGYDEVVYKQDYSLDAVFTCEDALEIPEKSAIHAYC
jgi:hypothetical protein